MEIENIIWESKMDEKWESLYRKEALIFLHKPECVIWENITDERVEWWFKKALEWEMYLLADIFKKEKEKRNLK